MKKAVAIVKAQKEPDFRGEKQSLRDIMAYYEVPREILQKRSLGVVEGMSHRSGGEKRPKVLSKGKN